MQRIDVLTGKTPPPTIEVAKIRAKKRPRPTAPATKPILPTRESVLPVHPLLAAIEKLPDSIFAFLTKRPDADFKSIRAEFKEWARGHLDSPDWRAAWPLFWNASGSAPADPQAGAAAPPNVIPFPAGDAIRDLLAEIDRAQLRRIRREGDSIVITAAAKGGVS